MEGAVVSASTGVMNSLLGKLSNLLEKEYSKLKGVRRDITFLKNELSTMTAVLEKYAMLEEPDVQMKAWIKEVRELSYDIEDCIDAFIHHVDSKPDKSTNIKGFLSKKIHKFKKLIARSEIANQIQELKALVVEASDRRARYKLDETPSNSSSVAIDPRLSAFFVEENRLVGIDGPRDKIIKLLIEEGESSSAQLKVLAIVGFGGLGKTTLANQVYHKIKWQFDCTAFVPISRCPDTKKILRDMLNEVGSSFDMLDDERQLINKLRGYLKYKRYLIIIDDIWRIPAWELIKSALPENKFHSRIIATTRIVDVAKSCCSSFHDQIYNIVPLNGTDSRRLFFRRIFHSKCSCPPQLEDVCNAILKKCGGLPLAIITIASLLANKPIEKDQWERVHNSISSGLEKNPTLEGMRKILLLSYYDLPRHLKTCLLYLSMFPENYDIERGQLVWRWIAEGFIAEERGQSLEQVGERYFNELVDRSMIQPVDVWYNGRARACRIHDMVLDLIMSLSIEENFVTVLDAQRCVSLPDKIRRCSFQSNYVEDELIQMIMKSLSHVRSLSIFGFVEQTPHLLSCHALRVLDLEGCYLEYNHIKYIGSLFQLKYLRLGYTSVTELPEQIGDLQYLETLDLRRCSLKKLPSTIVRLQKLVRLFVNRGVMFPDEIGNMHDLQELSYISSSNSIKFVEELGQLTKLRELTINCWKHSKMLGDMERYNETLESSLSKLGRCNLQSLDIKAEIYLLDSLMASDCVTANLRKLVFSRYRVPKWMVCLVNLTHLEIAVLRMEQKDVHVLGNIPTLLYLELSLSQGPRKRLIVSSQEFRHLKEFYFKYSGGGTGLVFAPGAMLELQRFKLWFEAREITSKYGSADSGIRHLLSLSHLHVTIDCDFATKVEVEAAEVALRNAATIHLNSPTLQIDRICEAYVVSDANEREELQEGRSLLRMWQGVEDL